MRHRTFSLVLFKDTFAYLLLLGFQWALVEYGFFYLLREVFREPLLLTDSLKLGMLMLYTGSIMIAYLLLIII